MFSRQNTGSLCIEVQSRFPENTWPLNLSKELNLRMLSFKAASNTSNACNRSCIDKHPCSKVRLTLRYIQFWIGEIFSWRHQKTLCGGYVCTSKNWQVIYQWSLPPQNHLPKFSLSLQNRGKGRQNLTSSLQAYNCKLWTILGKPKSTISEAEFPLLERLRNVITATLTTCHTQLLATQ